MTTAMIMNIIFLLSMYPVLCIMYFMIRYSSTGNGKYYFGITKSKEWNEYDKRPLEQIERDFKKSLKKNVILLAIVPVVTFFVPYFSISMTIWMIWLMVCIVVPFVPIAKAHGKVLAWKEEEKKKLGVYEEYFPKDATLTEISQAGEIRKVKPIAFILPSAVSLLVIVAGIWLVDIKTQWESLLSIGSIAIVTPIIYVMAMYFDKQKTAVISTDSQQNVNYARAKKQVWKDLWLSFAWENTVFTWLFFIAFLCYQKSPVMISYIVWGSIIYAVVLLVISGIAFLKMIEIEKHYAPVRMELEDTDQYWKWGIFYNNPHDAHAMVEQRIGMGNTVNLSTKAGKISVGFAGLALLSIPILCVWLIFVEFTPIHLVLENRELKAIHLSIDYKIPIDSMNEVELIEELPKWNRIAGSEMQQLEKGKFEIYSEGTCRVFLNPENAVFLKIVTDVDTYYLSGIDDSETLEIYEMIN